MIKANELRMGNWVLSSGLDQIVESIGEEGINKRTEWIGVETFDSLDGIPLTYDILEKAGFFGSKLSNSFKKYVNDVDNECIYVHTDGKGEWGTEYAYKNEFAPHKRKIKYLHELQNIYFCLTGEELEIKSPE